MPWSNNQSADSAVGMPPTNPTLGLILLAFATPLAVLVLPSDIETPGAVFLSALILTAALLAVPFARALKAPLSIARAEHLLMVGLVYWLLLDLLQGEYPLAAVSREGIRSALIAVALFAAGVWVAALFRPWPLPFFVRRAAGTQLRGDVLFVAMLICFALGFLRFAWPCGFNMRIMIDALSGNRWSVPWGRGDLGGWDAILDHFAYFGYVVPALTVMLAQQTRRAVGHRVALGVGLSAVMIVLLATSGGRRIVGVVCGAALLTWVLGKWGRVRLRTLLVAACGAILLIAFLELILEYRGIGYGEVFSSSTLMSGGYRIRVDDNILRVGQVFDLIPQDYGFVYLKYVVWIAARPIPRVLWPAKPVDPGFNLAQALGLRETSLSTTIVGEAYMSFGWIGIFLAGFLYGRLAGSFNLLIGASESPTRVMFYAFGVLSLFAGIRSGIELVLMSYTILVLIAVFALLRPTTFREASIRIQDA